MKKQYNGLDLLKIRNGPVGSDDSCKAERT